MNNHSVAMTPRDLDPANYIKIQKVIVSSYHRRDRRRVKPLARCLVISSSSNDVIRK